MITWKTEGEVTRLTLRRPEALNAMSWEMAEAFRKAAGAIAREKSKVLVIAGEGKAFSSGGDLGFIEDNRKRPKAALAARMRRFYGSFLTVRSLPQVTVAQVHGAAVGAGLCLALACDLRVVAASARLGFNFVKLGLNPGLAAWPLARAAFGDARARHLLMIGRFFSGAELHQWGAASELAETPEELAAKTDVLARELSGHSRLALRWLKAETTLDDRLEPYLKLEAKGQAEAFKGPELSEGLLALRQRRAPRF